MLPKLDLGSRPYPFDHIAVAFVDFKAMDFKCAHHFADGGLELGQVSFDLASLTKLLVNASLHLHWPQLFDPEMLLLLNHRSGLPIWGKLDRRTWRQDLFKFPIKPSPTAYSDYGAIRLGLRAEQLFPQMWAELRKTWVPEILHWTELGQTSYHFPRYGYRNFRPIQGQVNDDNAYNLRDKVAHAGLFAPLPALCQTLLKWQQEKGVLNHLIRAKDLLQSQGQYERYVDGWDTAQDRALSWAGSKFSGHTFGHLGFTGNSLWIDAEKQKAVVVLSNVIKEHWHQKQELRALCRELGDQYFG